MAMRRLFQILLLSVVAATGLYTSRVGAAPLAVSGPHRVFIPSVTSVKTAAITPTSTLNSQETELVSLINIERQRAGCRAPLVLSPELSVAARGHSLDMAVKDFFSHTGSDGSGPSQRATRVGYSAFVAGEIIGVGYTTAAAEVQGWLDSPPHKAIMLNCDLKEVGAGFVYDGNDALPWKYYWTAVFGVR